MEISSLALAANDQPFADKLLAHLERQCGRNASLLPLHSLTEQLIPGKPAILVLAISSGADAELAESAVQWISLQKWPLAPIVVESEAGSPSRDMAHLDPFIDRRFRWPGQAGALRELVRERLCKQSATSSPRHEDSLAAEIQRRLVGPTPSLLPLVRHLELAASHDITVLISGETGTGKTFLARLIHECSPRKDEPFVAVPCGALAANLIESELFGHVRGAFTGADRTKVGRFEIAGAGTILLDEIDTLGLEQQASLLRVVETGEYEPVGSHETRKCAARLIVASNWDLEKAVEEGKFRQDLWYRLNVLSIHLPPLRERVQDIEPLARMMAASFNSKFHKDLFDISPEAIAALENYPWPGNIRQLENALQQAVLGTKGPLLLREHLPQPVRHLAPIPGGHLPAPTSAPASGGKTLHQSGTGPTKNGSLEKALSLDECALIQRVLVENNYVRSRTASALGISRVTLYKKMKKHGLNLQSPWAIAE
jgi:DNA-binding NtrC family response regulator